ncbi:Uu.00g020210.m01.CDS01 [Anthostomella pinea]|uniref:Uu.00g020210.m01.CDS01 n=1 Tax=Anthostomella pinea TaxID=933095 RepID=A0AAI8VZF4_9PEZI|nr:Uu.00g020210.m01.CDS01 [Anthostomella pinea]
MASSHQIARRLIPATVSPLVASRQASRQLLPRISQRAASTSATQPLPVSRLKTFVYATTAALTGYAVYVYTTDTRAFVHRYVVPRLLRVIYPDAEEAHNAAVSSMKNLYSLNLHPRERATASSSDPDISVSVFGSQLANPIGISAGLDKHAEVPDALFALGASVVEVGGCTPRPQDGNPKPRMFRVPGLDGLINRYGLNSHGADDMAMRLRERVRRFAKTVGLDEASVLNGEANVPPGSLLPGRMLLVQIAKNKETDERDVNAVKGDYVYCVQRLAKYADVLVVNVSSPNTPGLRDLQAVEPLTRILSAVVDEAQKADRKVKPKVMVKVSPDEDEDTQMEGIVQAVWSSGVDGVIVGNTTKRRTGVIPPGVKITPMEQQILTETGGYSGPMMFERTADLVKRYRKLLDGQSLRSVEKKVVTDEAVDASIAAIDGTITGLPDEGMKPQPKPATDKSLEQKVIFATGGITNGQQALKMLNAGASIAMVYTGLVYGGAGTITRMKEEMRDEMVEREA